MIRILWWTQQERDLTAAENKAVSGIFRDCHLLITQIDGTREAEEIASKASSYAYDLVIGQWPASMIVRLAYLLGRAPADHAWVEKMWLLSADEKGDCVLIKTLRGEPIARWDHDAVMARIKAHQAEARDYREGRPGNLDDLVRLYHDEVSIWETPDECDDEEPDEPTYNSDTLAGIVAIKLVALRNLRAKAAVERATEIAKNVEQWIHRETAGTDV